MATRHHQLIIIGAGPAGLAAAVYAAREQLHPLVLDRGVVGGMAAITATIDNYPGFDNGIGGLEFADHFEAHAKRFGAQIRTGVEVTGLKRTATGLQLATTGGPLDAEAVLITTGSTYKQLGVPGEPALIGRGVHFCATCDAPLYKGKNLIVAGGGNSAMQETLFIAKFAAHVTILVRTPDLDGTPLLRDEILELPNVTVHYNTEVTSVNEFSSRFAGVTARDTNSGDTRDFVADGLFVFVGLLANTQAFNGALELDHHNFIATKPDFSTNLPGVFAAGDVRSGSTWQIASAAGEGVTAALHIRDYLAHLHHSRPAG